MKKYKLIIEGERYETKVVEYKSNYAKINVNGVDIEIDIERENTSKNIDTFPQTKSSSTPKPPSSPIAKETITKTPAVDKGNVLAPIPGTVLDIIVKVKDHVRADDVVLILEAMKMESEINAGTDGIVKAINVSKGDSVQENEVLIEIGVE